MIVSKEHRNLLPIKEYCVPDRRAYYPDFQVLSTLLYLSHVTLIAGLNALSSRSSLPYSIYSV